jgi:hypothetical protein
MHTVENSKTLEDTEDYILFECKCGKPVIEIKNALKLRDTFDYLRTKYKRHILWIINQDDKTYFHIEVIE